MFSVSIEREHSVPRAVPRRISPTAMTQEHIAMSNMDNAAAAGKSEPVSEIML